MERNFFCLKKKFESFMKTLATDGKKVKSFVMPLQSKTITYFCFDSIWLSFLEFFSDFAFYFCRSCRTYAFINDVVATDFHHNVWLCEACQLADSKVYS